MNPWLRYTSGGLATFLLLLLLHHPLVFTTPRFSDSTTSQEASSPSKIIVIGKLDHEDTSWVSRDLPDWQHAIYTVDNTSALLHTPRNKGRESIAYLTYIVDNYDSLADTVVFLHSHRDGKEKAWHVDNEEHDNVELVRALRIDFVARSGYVNLRCGLIPGCNHEVQPYRDPPIEGLEVEHAMHEAWPWMFGGLNIPTEIGVPCCAQFAVSKSQILARPKREYERFRQWILMTKLEDSLSGRVMEYLWHIIFGMQSIHCPDPNQCFCNVYGRCG